MRLTVALTISVILLTTIIIPAAQADDADCIEYTIAETAARACVWANPAAYHHRLHLCTGVILAVGEDVSEWHGVCWHSAPFALAI